MSAARFYLGTHQPAWLGRLDVPLFVSRRRLAGRKNPPAARAPWALDSGGFSELSLHGRWTITERQYVSEVCHWLDRPGKLEWAAAMDWMVEPMILAKTGGTVKEHQQRTVENYCRLADYCPEVPWVPVLQGWEHDDYFACLDLYAAAGVRLEALPQVGLGSVCRRQNTDMAENLIVELAARGLRLHAFGFKIDGLLRCADLLASADSMAWSARARKNPPLKGCAAHRNCANCPRYALQWREKVIRAMARGLLRPRQTALF